MTMNKPEVTQDIVVSKKDKELQRADKAHQFKEMLIRTKFVITRDFLVLSEILASIKDEELYKELGAETFDEFLAWPEISIHRSLAYDLVMIHNKLIVACQVAAQALENIDISKLRAIMPYISRENYGDWLDRARELTFRDLLGVIRRTTGRPESYRIVFEGYLNSPEFTNWVKDLTNRLTIATRVIVEWEE